MNDTFSRLMAVADVAKDVHIIAPQSNPYWEQWEDHIKHCKYRNTVHHWCGMNIRDPDSGNLLGHRTRIASTRRLSTDKCPCGRPRSHVHSLRTTRSKEELCNKESSPHQQALQRWATEILRTLNLNVGGPVATKGRYDLARNLAPMFTPTVVVTATALPAGDTIELRGTAGYYDVAQHERTLSPRCAHDDGLTAAWESSPTIEHECHDQQKGGTIWPKIPAPILTPHSCGHDHDIAHCNDYSDDQ